MLSSYEPWGAMPKRRTWKTVRKLASRGESILDVLMSSKNDHYLKFKSDLSVAALKTCPQRRRERSSNR